MFSGAAFAILPYLTIHMKDIGISDIDVALIYTILPFCVFIAPPVVGFFADKLGNYTRVLMANIVMVGVFHTLLLFVPHNVITTSTPSMNVTIEGNAAHIQWEPCPGNNDIQSNCQVLEELPEEVKLSLSNCSLVCKPDMSPSMPVEEQLCKMLKGSQCKPNPVRKLLNLKGLLPNITNEGCGSASLVLETGADPCVNSDAAFSSITLPKECRAECSAKTNVIR